jgi:acyl-CoA thioesterase I
MRNVFIIGISFVVISIFYLILFHEKDYAIKNYPSSGETIVAFGDSLVEGIGAIEGEDFVSVLSQRLQIPIINLGVSGDTTADGLIRVEDVLSHNPKIVLVLLGGNDFLKRVPKEEIFQNLTEIITRIQDGGAIVILLGVQGGVFRDGFEKEYEELSEILQTAYIPNVLDGLIGKPDYMFDALHPNTAGNMIIADKIFPVLQQLLE